jgi:hypothetical protein
MNDKPRYIHKQEGEIYELTVGTKLSADGQPEKVYQLKSDRHYHECNETDFQKTFEKI